jgi:proline iminopeptidase
LRPPELRRRRDPRKGSRGNARALFIFDARNQHEDIEMSSDKTTRIGSVREEPTARSSAARIDEGAFVPILGLDHWLTFRGDDGANPALLVLGGPGAALSSWASLLARWERHFTIVQWDQPGGGATLAKNGDAATGALSIERLVRDGIAVIEHARARLAKKRIVLLGISGGSILSLAIASRRPDLVFACVGTGQVIHWERQNASSYAQLLERARSAGDADAIADLERIGPPPYDDVAADVIKSKYAGAVTPAEAPAFAELVRAVASPPPDATYIPRGLVLGDQRANALAAFKKMRAEILAFDARRFGHSFRVPMFFFQGEQDLYTTTDEVSDYVEAIDAPHKLLVLVPGAGHCAFVLSDALLELLRAHVLPLALDAER